MEQKEKLKVSDIHKSYGDNTVLRGVSLTANAGDVISIIGSSGSGKSTFLRCINMLEKPNQGTIALNGELLDLKPSKTGDLVANDSKQLQHFRSRLCMVFQHFNLWQHMTVLENLIEAPIRVLGLSKAEAVERARKYLDKVGLQGAEDKFPSAMSGGQQQRVAIARALVCRPQLLLLDEPFSNIDAQVRWSLIREIRALLKSLNMAAVFVTHSKEEAFAFADRLALLEKGRVVQIGTPKQLYHQPASPYVAEFLGRGNLVRCDWLAAGHLASALGEIRVESDPAACPEPLLFVRPQLLAVTPGGQGAVLEQQFLGSHVRCLIDWQGEHYEAWHHEWLTEPECGVSLALRPHAPVLFSRTEWPQLHSRL